MGSGSFWEEEKGEAKTVRAEKPVPAIAEVGRSIQIKSVRRLNPGEVWRAVKELLENSR